MRRALLTARAPAVPIAVGNTGSFGTTALSSRTAVDISDPATGSGTITSVSIHAASGDLHIMTGSLAGTNFTVRAVSPQLTATSGLNNFTVALPVLAGDFIGCWWVSTAGARYQAIGGFDVGRSSNPTTLPTAGTVISLGTTPSARLSILGTG